MRFEEIGGGGGCNAITQFLKNKTPYLPTSRCTVKRLGTPANGAYQF